MRLSLVLPQGVCCRVRLRVHVHQTNQKAALPHPPFLLCRAVALFACVAFVGAVRPRCVTPCSPSRLSHADGFYPSTYEMLAVRTVDRHTYTRALKIPVLQMSRKCSQSASAAWMEKHENLSPRRSIKPSIN